MLFTDEELYEDYTIVEIEEYIIDCETCHGTGTVNQQFEEFSCPECDGTGDSLNRGCN